MHPILTREIEEWEHLDNWYKMLEHLVIRARTAASGANSYRGFAVGCSVWAYKPNTPIWAQPWKIFTAANEKISPSEVKNCAERKAVLAALAENYTRIIGLVVAGRPQADADSKLIERALPPCLACRKFLLSTPGVSAQTRILMVHLTEPIGEEITFEELLRRHGMNFQSRK
ncbi:MAG: hypothetical protein M1275_00910 [Patescibacteria group bacterium]|nr:hypothetical protein [Patescibacteria group bacterium]